MCPSTDNPMEKVNGSIFDECVTCKQWSSLVKKHTDGNYYCPIHYNRQIDMPISKKRAKQANDWLTWFRQVKETAPNDVNEIG